MIDFEIVNADCLEHLATLEADSVDAIVSDPPYGLSFMGKGWDHSVPGPEYFAAQLRVAKPGAHLVAFGGTRTYHRLACAIEDAGWEMRDCLMWLYGSGFPKSHDVSKGIDAAAGAEREVVGPPTRHAGQSYQWAGDVRHPATDAAKQWDGWGTALKPAWEPIILARKPLAGTVAANVLEHGTGAINVDECRIGTDDGTRNRPPAKPSATTYAQDAWTADPNNHEPFEAAGKGRWPANVLLDPEAAAALDKQSGERPAGNVPAVTGARAVYGGLSGHKSEPRSMGDSGGASRFFYCAKASRSEREAGLENFTAVAPTEITGRKPGSAGHQTPYAGMTGEAPRRNTHPTVKPIELMQWLCRLVTPPGGLILDPFCGSGTTGCAAVREDMRFLGIELDPGHAAIARARVEHHAREPRQMELFT